MITVILCTYNRCASLAKTLDSISKSNLPESRAWEVLVVDNNSTDQTREVVQEFCQRYPDRWRYFFEAQPGKSHALNSGVREARGDILVFTDDDVMVDTAWLENLTAGLHSGGWAGAGGRIVPQWPCPPPSWIPRQERYGLAPLVQFDLGPEAGPLTEPPFGANMAFLREVFQKYGAFRTDLGPRPNGETCKSEDIEFGQRLLAKGERLRYEPTAVVHHAVAEDRLQKGYFLRWWLDKARSDIRANGGKMEAKWRVGGTPIYLIRRLVFWTLRWMVTLDPPERFACKVSVWRVLGTIMESRYQWSLRRATVPREADTR